jgi:hypothetical protein
MSTTRYLREAFDIANTDKGFYHGYEHMYAFIFSGFTPKSIFEIGVKDGNSILAWQKLFPSASITGMDIKHRNTVARHFEYIVGDSTIYPTTNFPSYDIIIDDGSHKVEDQIKTFMNFKDKFNFYYVIEDINLIKDDEPNSDRPVKMLIDTITGEGYKGIATFSSYNERKVTKSLVITSLQF